jgi:hypothetical protein
MPSLETEWKNRHNRHVRHLSRNISVCNVTDATQELSRHLSRTARMVLWVLKRDRWRDRWVTDPSTHASRDKCSTLLNKIAPWAACDRRDAHLPDLSKATLKLKGRPPPSRAVAWPAPSRVIRRRFQPRASSLRTLHGAPAPP